MLFTKDKQFLVIFAHSNYCFKCVTECPNVWGRNKQLCFKTKHPLRQMLHANVLSLVWTDIYMTKIPWHIVCRWLTMVIMWYHFKSVSLHHHTLTADILFPHIECVYFQMWDTSVCNIKRAIIQLIIILILKSVILKPSFQSVSVIVI